MATHNSLFSEKDVRRTADGIAVAVQLPWYRSLWLSAVDDVAASVDEALAELADGDVHDFQARRDEARHMVIWQEDAEYDPAAGPAGDAGPRHRLVMDSLPWVYLNAY